MLGKRTHPSGCSHPLIPPLIEVACKCGGKVVCVHPTNAKGYSDTPEGWWLRAKEDHSFIAKCNKCHFSKKNLSYFEVIKIGPPYYSASVGLDNIWGWNREHFETVIQYLEGFTVSNRWQRYMRYIPGKWKSVSRRSTYVKAAKKLLQCH